MEAKGKVGAVAAFVRLVIVMVILYGAGRIMYQGRSKKVRFRMYHVVAAFVLIMVVNALIMAALLVVSFGAMAVLFHFFPGLHFLFSEEGKLSGANLLTYIFVLIFLTAFAQYGLRHCKPIRERRWFTLGDDEYQIIEYFIQWITIYLVIYQSFFDGLSSLVMLAQQDATTIQEVFSIALAPQNLNLVLQPMLISSWVLVVLERFARRNKPRAKKEPKTHVSPAVEKSVQADAAHGESPHESPRQ